jgi:hypothetical protein
LITFYKLLAARKDVSIRPSPTIILALNVSGDSAPEILLATPLPAHNLARQDQHFDMNNNASANASKSFVSYDMESQNIHSICHVE